MKRFYAVASIAAMDGGFAILLDDHMVRTPARAALTVPTHKLAEAIAEEWNAQGETIDPRAMPCTGLANAAIDRVDPDPAAFAQALVTYGENDLICYRATHPQSLVELQAAFWDPLLAWARGRFDIDFTVVQGIVYHPQPPTTLQRLKQGVAALTGFALAGLSPLVTISGSLIIALALVEKAINLDAAWAAASLDERWQAEHWGADAEAMRALEVKRQEFFAASYFLTLLD